MATLSGILILSLAGCKGSTTPSSTTSTIVVNNNCGATIMVYVDGTLKATIDDEAYATIDNVAEGSRLVEAKKADTGLLLTSSTLTIKVSTTTSMTVEGIAILHVTNQYGEILSIFQDTAYVGDIGDQITQNLSKVKFGTHTYEAKKKTDATVVATITFDVTDILEYSWTITK